MKKRLQIITFIVLVYNYSFSQLNVKEAAILKNYKYFNEKSYVSCGDGNWSKKYKLNNGFVSEVENYLDKRLMSEQRKIYDNYGNVIFEIIYSSNKVDTLSKGKYDEFNRIIEKEYSYGMIEKFSNFDNNSKPKLIERFNKDGKTLYFWPISENRDFDDNGNLIKEVKTEIDYPKTNTDTIKKFSVETNIYKYDKLGYVTEIKRSNNSGESYPIYMVGGISKYQTENFEYEYDNTGLWTKKYWIVDGKKTLLFKRKYKK